LGCGRDAFPIQKDILDETASTEILGKEQGRDRMLGKSTFPKLLGLNASETMARDLVAQAHHALSRLPGDTTALQGLATLSVERNT
jgi:Geranylgeranyl pyrophosphate synthase